MWDEETQGGVGSGRDPEGRGGECRGSGGENIDCVGQDGCGMNGVQADAGS